MAAIVGGPAAIVGGDAAVVGGDGRRRGSTILGPLHAYRKDTVGGV